MAYTLLPGTRAPVRVWTDPAGIEPEAQRQLRNIDALPWVQGVAVSPTCTTARAPRSAR